MIDITDLTKYAQCRAILEALTRAGNRQSQTVQDALVTDRDAERAKYYELLGAVNQAQMACDSALLVIARAILASENPGYVVVDTLDAISMYSHAYIALAPDIVTELVAITKEAQ
jgi:hypothetical protein